MQEMLVSGTIQICESAVVFSSLDFGLASHEQPFKGVSSTRVNKWGLDVPVSLKSSSYMESSGELSV